MVEKIKKLCEINNLSLTALEKEAGLNRGSIYRWDKNAPSIDKVQKVADYFGCTVDYLLGSQKVASSETDLSPDELEMLEIYKALKADDRKRVKALARTIDKILGVDE